MPEYNIDEIIKIARDKKASDIHINAQRNIIMRIHGKLEDSGIAPYPDTGCDPWILQLVPDKTLGEQNMANRVDMDFCYQLPGTELRHRVNIFYQRGRAEAVIRILNDEIPSFASLKLPDTLIKLASYPRGMVLVTGPTGSGKSTTLAAMVDYINETRKEHILTIEDPIEYMYQRKQSLIRQREVGVDVPSFADALRSALREDPDVILVGEMRDYETISAAVTAAETGHLVFSTLHTTGAVATIDRIIDVFPPASQQQIRTQLASVLRGVITQNLLPLANKPGRVVATEIMINNDAIANLIRENKAHQITSTIETSGKEGMHTLNSDLARLVQSGLVDKQAALERSTDKKALLGLI